MAISTGAALLGSAVLGAGASVAAGNRAASASTQGAQAGSDAILQASRESNAMQQRMFDTAWAAGAPWRAAGQQALGSLQSFMGMTPQTTYAAPTTTTGGAPVGGVPATGGSYPVSNPTPVAGAPGGAMQTANPVYQSATPWMQQGGTFLSDVGPGTTRASGDINLPFNLRVSQQQDGGGLAGLMASNPGVSQPPQAPQPIQAPQTVPGQNAAPIASQAPTSTDPNAGFNQFLNSTNYQFTRQQGENALSRLMARQGLTNSGRGMTAAIDYGQNMAHSNAIMPYMNQLNVMAGLGQNAAMMGGNQAMQLGGMMGNNIMNAGNAAGNALMQGGANRASAYANTGNAISNLFNQYGMYRGWQSGMFGGPTAIKGAP